MEEMAAPAGAYADAPRVEELILSGADVSVLNHTTLSLWHFRQLVLEMLPPAAAEPEEDPMTPETPAVERDAAPSRSIELGEGMSIAAVLYERPVDALDAEKSGLEDAQETGDNNNRTERRPVLQVQGVTTSILGHLTPDTHVAAVFQRYRCVLCLDASPSILSIDPSSGRLFLDLLYESVELFIWSLLRPMEVGGVAFTPELHVSVLVQGALVESLCVLMQGYIVTQANAASFLQLIKERFQLIENDWAKQAQELGQWGYLGNATPASLDWVLQNAVFALNSLPTDCAPMMVLVTDGVMDVRDAYSYDNLLMQLVRHDIQCHFLRIGGGGEDELNATFGFVPDTHLLRFVAEYTGGTVFDYAGIHEACYGSTSASSDTIKKMTGLQDACFLRKSSVHANSAPVVKLNDMDSTSFDGRTLLPLRPYRMWREKVHEYRIFADVNRIVEARLREGFSINKVYVKTYQQPFLADGGPVQAGTDSPRHVNSGGASANAPNGRSSEVTKILIVFLLQWKQNVWLEYVVSTTTESSVTLTASTSSTSHAGRRASGQGFKGATSFASGKKTAAIFSKDHRAAWSEWYVKMNILAYADFLRAFEDTLQRPSGDRSSGARGAGGDVSMASPVFVHDFIRNVQDVDRVLLHLMTATASISETSDSVSNQFSFGTSANSASASVTPKITSSHPVFNIIGELSTVLWHRWFFVERFEILCVVKSDSCTDLFYRNEMHGVVEHGSSGLRGVGNAPPGIIHSHGANVYGTSNGNTSIGVESLAEPLIAILVKWSSQKLSQDLFLKFLRPTTGDKSHAPPRAKPSPSSASAPGGIAQRRRQRSHNSNAGEDASHGEDTSSMKESKAALCFVRLEFKNKTLCAVHVAFFATRASTRRQVLNDLKSTIFAGINEVAVAPSPAKLLSSSLADTPVILCHRMLSRLLVTHDTLLLHGIDQEPGPFDYYVASPTLEAEKNAGAIPPSSTCCGGSELQLHRVFGAYVWHSSWKWEMANLTALLDVMRRLHDARISCGFWVLDWKMEGDDGHGTHVESVIFGREILMEDEKGHMKTALVQYALRRVSDTCLMTSFWMEPQHGIVKARLSDEVDTNDRFHWSLKQAIGHSSPFENYESRGAIRNSTPRAPSGRGSASSVSSVEDEQKAMEQEDVSIDWSGGYTYLGESELLHLIRGYLFKSDRHFLSCLYTFDSIINLRENIELLNQLSKDVEDVVGSNWSMDRQLAAENGMILPPFSTARLLATSKRSTEHFLMYLQNDNASESGVDETAALGLSPSVSTANDNLYSMLELTLRGLSDCEVSWTDYNGDVVAEAGTSTISGIEEDQFFREGMDGQLPLWLKQHLTLTFQDRVPHHALSKGKCFAKLVSEDCVVLAFFPSLDSLPVQGKNAERSFKASNKYEAKLQFEDRLNMPRKAPEKAGEHKTSAQQFSVRAAEEDGTKSRVVRMSVSADDIVLYQERRRSFREGYKSWRMGHFQGSRDEKQSYGRDFQKLRLPSTPEDHEFCEEISRRAPYGCDFHLLIDSATGVLGSGFFQVAFYECSLSRLSTDLHDKSNQMLDRVDLPHTILKQLFFSKRSDRQKEDRPAIPVDRSGLWKKSPSARSPLESSGNPHSRGSLDTSLASRRFRKKVKRAHEHNFSRGVYMALREGGAVQHSDLLQALSSCIEVPVDVDITLLYRMMETAASHKIPPLSPAAAAVVSAGIGVDILKDKLTKSFEKIFASVFIPIAGTKYYYFTGNENTTYEDPSSSEYDLHILMEDSDDGESGVAESQKGNENERNDGEVITGEVERTALDQREGAPQHNVEAGEKRPVRRRRGSLGRELPPPVNTSTEESSGGEQQQPNVEEDAEFNKEVAVATSSFSVPFFFRFECRVLNGSRETRSNSANTHGSGEIPDSELLRRSSSTAVYEDMRKDMVAQKQLSSPSSRQEEFNAFLESLKSSQGLHKHSNSADVTQIAESFSRMSSGRIALRLVTLTLPNERAYDGGHVPPQMPFEMDNSGGQPGKSNALPSLRPQSFSMLHLFQRQVLTRVRKDIKEWCSVEILSILKSTNEVTPSVGALVQRLFDDLPSEAVTKAKYPLEFVAQGQETPVNPLDLFKREFEKGDLLNVHRCNGVYFVVEKNSSTRKVAGGLDSSPDSEDTVDTGFEIPYWAYFELEADHISLRLHHPGRFKTSSKQFNRLEVLTRLQLGIRAVCRRVNQFLLLLQLHETRTCNGLLLPPNGNMPSSPRSPKRRNGSQGAADSMGGKDGQVKQASFFWPGQFECDLRYSAFFKLHERLSPNFALNMLCTSALEQFQVHNRRHIFVYRDRDGHVFYMKISIFYDTTLSPVTGSQPIEERQERSGFARSSTGGSSGGGTTSTNTTPPGVPGIRLEVFGVSEAGEEVTHELCRLLERKLDEATQVVLMKLLARNTKFQLSQTDLTFLCPPSAEPSSVVDYALPDEVADCCTLLHYLSQTLKLAPYIRPATMGGSLPSWNQRDAANNSSRRTRRGSLASAGSNVSLPVEAGPRPFTLEKSAEMKTDDDKETPIVQDSTLLHPACFAAYENTLADLQKEAPSIRLNPAIRSPVFFSSRPEAGAEGVVSGEPDLPVAAISASPEVVAQASYVLNLNPDLRLSQGFLSRVGKGLALMRVDLIRNSTAIPESSGEGKEAPESDCSHKIKSMRDIPGLATLYSSSSTTETSSTLVARCQVWIRGSIHVMELSEVIESFMDEALYDYHIEATIKKLQLSTGQNDTYTSSKEGHPDVSGTPGSLPSDVDTLLSLFKSACLLPSSSVTNLGVNLSIAPWDLENAVAQIRSFLSCLPYHLRPAVYAKSRLSGSYKNVGSRTDVISLANDPPPYKFRLVVRHAGGPDVCDSADSSDSDAETTASMSSAIHHIEPLMRTDSIHSEISDIDSVSGLMPLTWASTGASSDSITMSQIQAAPSVSSTTSSLVGIMGGMLHQPYVPKSSSFTERDVLLYSSSGNSHHHHRKSESHEHREVKRSFYYVVDLSTSKGLRLYGYNMSTALVQALATHMARVLTWTMLREKLLRSLLLEKSGISGAAPVGAVVLQPRSLFLTVGRTERAGKGVAKSSSVLCKDSAVHFIEYRPPVLSILQSSEWFPRVLDASRLRSIDGTALGLYLREAQTQPAMEAFDAQYQRPRGKSNTNMGASMGPPSIPDLSREASGPSLSQRSLHDASSNLMGSYAAGRTRSGGIVSSSNVSDSVSSSPSKRLSGPSPALPYPGGNRSEVATRMRGVAGAATALMAARARARGGGALPNRMGSGPGLGAARGGGNSGAASAALSGDSVAPWDLPLSNIKGPRLHAPVDGADLKASGDHDGNHANAPTDTGTAVTTNVVLKATTTGASRPVRRGSRGTGLAELGTSSSSSSLSGLPSAPRRASSNDTVASDPGRIHSSWKKRLECAWGPRFLFPGNSERWASRITAQQRQHFVELDDDEDGTQPKKSTTPLPYFCAALERRWEAFETRSTSHTVGMNLLEKLASLRGDEEMEEPVAQDVVAHLVASGHLLLHQRFRAAFVERWIAAEVIGVPDGEEEGVMGSRLRALQSCMNLVHLLSYKREFVFDQDDCSVAKLYTEHTVLSMGAGVGADVRGIKQQVAANLEPLRLEVASEFYKEYAVHLRTLGFRRLRTLNTSRSHARAFPVDPSTETECPGAEGFSEFFYHPERAAAEAGDWKVDLNSSHNDPLSIVVLEVKCDNRGIRLTAVLVSLNDLEQQDLRFQNRLAAKAGKRVTGASGSRIQSVASWLRGQLQTQALIYGFTIRYFQQHLLQWINDSQDFHNSQSDPGHSVGKHLSDDDALVVTPPMPWKKASTFQNIVKGLQCFLHAFPDPPEEIKSASLVASNSSAGSRSPGGKYTAKPSDPRSPLTSTGSVAPGSDSHRSTSRGSRFARRTSARHQQQHQATHQQSSPAKPKPAAPLSMLWHDCVIRMATVTLQPTSLQSNCSELILVQILLRYIACHGSRYEVLDLLQFGTPDTVVCHSSSGSFFHRPPSTINPSTRKVEPLSGYSLVITSQPLTRKPVDKDSVQLLLLKSTPSELGVGNGVLPIERALQEAQLFTRELFHVASQHYERDLLWSRLLFDDSRGPGADVAHSLALPPDLFRVEVGPQQLEECLRLSICTPLETLDPRLDELLRVSGVCWQELALRLRDIYADQLREFQFQEEDENSSHLLLLCPDTFDLIIHLTFVTPKDPPAVLDQGEDGARSVSSHASGESSSPRGSDSINGSRVSNLGEAFSDEIFEAEEAALGDVRVEICRREEPSNKQFTFAQRRAISEFVNSIVHWQWRSLIYD